MNNGRPPESLVTRIERMTAENDRDMNGVDIASDTLSVRVTGDKSMRDFRYGSQDATSSTLFDRLWRSSTIHRTKVTPVTGVLHLYHCN